MHDSTIPPPDIDHAGVGHDRTRWGPPVTDYATRADGSSSWGAPDPPASVPGPMAGIGTAYRVGWLYGRHNDQAADDQADDDGPGGAA